MEGVRAEEGSVTLEVMQAYDNTPWAGIDADEPINVAVSSVERGSRCGKGAESIGWNKESELFNTGCGTKTSGRESQNKRSISFQ